MENRSPEEESKTKVLEQYQRLKDAQLEYGWTLDLEDKEDYFVIYILMVSNKNPGKKLLAKLKCDDYPRQPPVLEFINPAAITDASLRNDVRPEFYPVGQGIANDPVRSPMPVVCLPGHRIYHANGWHSAWTVPPPTALQIYFFIDRLQTSLNNDWS